MEYKDILLSFSLTKWRTGGYLASPGGNYGCLVEKLQLYEPSISSSSGQEQPVDIRFGVVHLVHCQELCSLCIKIGQLL